MKIVIGILAFLLISIFGWTLIAGISFDINIGQHLKRAADANTLKLAQEELSQALKIIEARNLKEGNTSILIPSPSNDLDFWYRNLKASLSELDLALANTKMSQLEQSNVLMKLRETILDEGGESLSITRPAYISVHPYQRLIAILIIIIILGIIIAFLYGMATYAF